jgi:hypothetical protein
LIEFTLEGVKPIRAGVNAARRQRQNDFIAEPQNCTDRQGLPWSLSPIPHSLE